MKTEEKALASPLILYLDDYTDQEVARLMDMLPAWRRDQALRFRHQSGRSQSVLAYVALCRALRERYGIDEMPDFDYNEHGKPSLRQYPDIHFNLSHCPWAVGCLVADSPCGLDLEALRPIREGLVYYTMSATEARHISLSDEPEVTFLTFWTQKEAVLKLFGTGINGSMKDVLAPERLQGLCLHTELNRAHSFVCSWAIEG